MRIIDAMCRACKKAKGSYPGSSRTKEVAVLGWQDDDRYMVALYDRHTLHPIYEGRLRSAVLWVQETGMA